LHARAARLYG